MQILLGNQFTTRWRSLNTFQHTRGNLVRVPLGGVLGDQLHLLISGLHGWEQQNLLNVVLVGQEHCKTIDSQTKTSSWWQSVLEGGDEGIIHHHGFVITLAAVLGLIHEQLVLNNRVIQFCVSICELKRGRERGEPVS